jgi:hypothetical protein
LTIGSSRLIDRNLVKRQENLGGQNLRAQIYGQGTILDPRRRSTFNKGGGGSGIERAGFDGLDWGTRIYGQDWIPDPLCLSTFNKGGGGGPEWVTLCGSPETPKGSVP